MCACWGEGILLYVASFDPILQPSFLSLRWQLACDELKGCSKDVEHYIAILRQLCHPSGEQKKDHSKTRGGSRILKVVVHPKQLTVIALPWISRLNFSSLHSINQKLFMI